MQKILYDGWPLVYQPNHPAAIHLLTLLDYHPEQFLGTVALPGPSMHVLPAPVEQIHIGGRQQGDDFIQESPSRLIWEQKILPGLARKVGASLVHLTSGGAALFGKTRYLLSPAGYWDDGFYVKDTAERLNLTQRLRQAVAYGALSLPGTILWPQDLPAPQTNYHLVQLPPVAPASFMHATNLDSLPGSQERSTFHDIQNFIIYLGPSSVKELKFLLNIWRWTIGPIGDGFQLAIFGGDSKAQERIHKLACEFHLEESVRVLPALSVSQLANIFRACRAVIHSTRLSPWGGTMRLALASGKPVVGIETRLTDALLGSAGYLLPQAGNDEQLERSLAAALISVSIEDSLADSLSELAFQRAEKWNASHFSKALAQLYEKLVL